MKHILPILTLTTLAAAASAQSAAAPAGLSYNRVTVSREGQNNTMSASALLGGTNVLATASTGNGAYYSGTTFSLGYVFKNVAFATDATVSISSGNRLINSAVSVNLRRALNEVYAGLEVSLGYSYASNSDSGYQGDPDGSTGVVTAEIAYNVNKTWQVAVGLSNQNPSVDRLTVLSVRHNF